MVIGNCLVSAFLGSCFSNDFYAGNCYTAVAGGDWQNNGEEEGMKGKGISKEMGAK